MGDPTDDLYRLPPSEFIAARDQAVRDLRAAGERPQATRVKGLRRPTVTAWALNQLRDRAPDELDRLGRLHRRLQNKRKPKLQEALAERREIISALSVAAHQALDEAGLDPGPRAQEIAGTLEAAVLDEDVLEQLRAGRLTTAAAPPGLEALGLLR